MSLLVGHNSFLQFCWIAGQSALHLQSAHTSFLAVLAMTEAVWGRKVKVVCVDTCRVG